MPQAIVIDGDRDGARRRHGPCPHVAQRGCSSWGTAHGMTVDNLGVKNPSLQDLAGGIQVRCTHRGMNR